MDKLFIPRAREGKKQWYCGPYVMAAVTGYSFDVIRTVINKAKHRPLTTGICGVMPQELIDAFALLNWEAEVIYDHKADCSPKLILKDFMKSVTDDDIYVVYVTGHYVAVQGGMFIDTYSTHKVSTAFAPRPRKQIKEIYRLTKY
jgi:hypothetical protein